ncbi:MAG TPA: 50S ribosomal protein L10 [Candidatus Saccharimonadales bacterium]|nr:50S ribosomal protein L10 [Candidatus Saccharimonadales bacterium]
MAITRAEKEAVVEQLSSDLSRFKLAVLTDYRGLSVAEIKELRQALSAEGISYRVTKNTLLRLAAAASPTLKSIDPASFSGPMALAIGFDDEVAPARVIFQFAKTHEALEIVGALTPDGRLLSAAEVKALAQMPSRDQLLGQVVGTIAAPLSGLVGVLGANVRSIVNVLNAISNLEEK